MAHASPPCREMPYPMMKMATCHDCALKGSPGSIAHPRKGTDQWVLGEGTGAIISVTG